MAIGVNKVMLVGNLGADPDVRYLEGGAVVANVSLATTEVYTNRRGEQVQHTEWHRLEMWDGAARQAEQHLRKGDLIHAEGKLRTDQWQDREGNARTTVRVRVTDLTLLHTYRAAGGPGAAAEMHPAPPRLSDPVPADMASLSSGDEELPF